MLHIFFFFYVLCYILRCFICVVFVSIIVIFGGKVWHLSYCMKRFECTIINRTKSSVTEQSPLFPSSNWMYYIQFVEKKTFQLFGICIKMIQTTLNAIMNHQKNKNFGRKYYKIRWKFCVFKNRQWSTQYVNAWTDAAKEKKKSHLIAWHLKEFIRKWQTKIRSFYHWIVVFNKLWFSFLRSCSTRIFVSVAVEWWRWHQKISPQKALRILLSNTLARVFKKIANNKRSIVFQFLKTTPNSSEWIQYEINWMLNVQLLN